MTRNHDNAPLLGAGRFCRTCRYDLGRVASTTCPECGRAFDPNDDKTYLHYADEPRSEWLSFLKIWGLGCLGIIVGLILLGLLATVWAWVMG